LNISNKHIKFIYEANKKEIEEDNNKLKQFKHSIEKKINELEELYSNRLFYIDNYYKNEKIENDCIQKKNKERKFFYK